MPQPVFEIDRQTLGDLAIFPGNKGDYSIHGLFDYTATYGGRDKLHEFFSNPSADAELITRRVAAIQYIHQTRLCVNLDKSQCDYIEFYLKRHDKPTSVSKIRAIERKAMFFFTGNNDYYVITRGIVYTLELLNELIAFVGKNDFEALPLLLQQFHTTIGHTLSHPDFEQISGLSVKKRLNGIDIAKGDHLFRYLGFERLQILLSIAYQLDVLITVSSRMDVLGFSLPVIKSSAKQVLVIDGLFHPFIKDPVGNDISFTSDKNICFLTGANMAGKSTFLKSVGVAVFLSQIGFPVPATHMETSIFEGLITTINLSDNLQQGNSHFYTEVARVKHVANTMTASQNVVVIFDELFRGTNVKDAYDASFSIISAFAKLNKGFFIISTHIVEVAHDLAAISNINFKYMETHFDENIPQYSYQLKDGITEVRMGMWIVKNEGIVDIIEKLITKDAR